jgi:hypothetical protein
MKDSWHQMEYIFALSWLCLCRTGSDGGGGGKKSSETIKICGDCTLSALEASSSLPGKSFNHDLDTKSDGDEHSASRNIFSLRLHVHVSLALFHQL